MVNLAVKESAIISTYSKRKPDYKGMWIVLESNRIKQKIGRISDFFKDKSKFKG